MEPVISSQQSPGVMDQQERKRVRAAAYRAQRIYPDAVGELLYRELLTWEEFGFRLDRTRLTMRVVEAIENQPLKEGKP